MSRLLRPRLPATADRRPEQRWTDRRGCPNVPFPPPKTAGWLTKRGPPTMTAALGEPRRTLPGSSNSERLTTTHAHHPRGLPHEPARRAGGGVHPHLPRGRG